MIIANPIYDVIFKRLLENDRVAKFFIGAILDCEVLSLVPTTIDNIKPDEVVLTATLFNKYFAATIVTKDEGEKSVIIEIQKVNLLMEIYQFWDNVGKKYTPSKLPIITIYIVGFTLSVDTPAFGGKVSHYRDLLTNEELVVRDHFVEQLTHCAYFIQIPRIKPCQDTTLNMVLSIFEQANFIGNSTMWKDYSFEVDILEMKEIVGLLRDMVTDTLVYRALEKELYYKDAMEDAFGKRDRKFAENKHKIEEVKREFEEAKHEMVVAKRREEEAKQREEEAKQREEVAKRETEEVKRQQFETARALKYDVKMPTPRIAEITKLTEAEIERL